MKKESPQIDGTRRYIEQKNDAIHGRYPMTKSILLEQIDLIPKEMMQFDDKTRIYMPVRAFLKGLIESDLIKNMTMDLYYEFYLDSVKPFVLKS